MGLFDKVAAISAGIKDKVVSAAEEAELASKFSNLKDKTAEHASAYLETGKEHAGRLTDAASAKLSEVDFDALKRGETYVTKFHEYREYSTEKVVNIYRSTFEVDKTTSEMIEDIRGRLPSRPTDVDDIFEQCKREAFQRAISAFCLAPIMQGLDKTLEGRYANLSVDYKDFKEQNNLHDDPNFARMKNERFEARANGMTPLTDAYNKSTPLNPYDADIEHVVAKKNYYDDWILKGATNDDEIIAMMNHPDNLTFTNESVNGSKSDWDIQGYLAHKAQANELRVDDDNPDKLYLSIGGVEREVSKSDMLAADDKARENLRRQHFEAAKEIGLTMASTGARMAAQQVVGLIVMETVDIFIDEIKDICRNGKFFDENGLLANIKQRQQNISDKLAQRFEERQIWARAKVAGIEGGVAGALSAIPQILISLIVKMPGFMLSIIRECTLSVVRSVRVLLSNEENKFDSIKVVMMGTASAVLGVYVANVISKAIRPVPMLNVFNGQVTAVLTGVVTTAAPLGAIYVFDQNKAKFSFAVFGGKGS